MMEFPVESCAPGDDYYENVIAAKSLFDKREVHLRVMMFNLRLSVTSEPHGQYYEEQYCYHDATWAWIAFTIWDGESVPPMWAKHPTTGTYGPGCKTCSQETPIRDEPPKRGEHREYP